MRIAHLILAHTDPRHIARLIKRVSTFSDVFVHIDAEADINSFLSEAGEVENCFWIQKRVHCSWGGWNAVIAEIELIRFALRQNDYDRLVFLQGADYPLKSNRRIEKFYRKYPDVEFIRACCCTGVKSPYFYEKCRYFLFYNNVNRLKTLANLITLNFHLKLHSGYIREKGRKYKVYWGGAQWALTGDCAKYVVEFYDTHKLFNHWFLHAFPADELYFTTVVMNSPFRNATSHHGPEPAEKGLVNWRNLHYFEYPPGKIKVLSEEDYGMLKKRPELYVRKVTTEDSSSLLDLLDQDS